MSDGVMNLALNARYLNQYDLDRNGLDRNEAANAVGSLVSLSGGNASVFNLFKAASNLVTRPAEVNTGAFSGVNSTTVEDLTGNNFNGLSFAEREYESDNSGNSFRYFFFG